MRRADREERKPWRTGIVFGALAIVLGVLGLGLDIALYAGDIASRL